MHALPLAAALADVPDPRRAQGTRHPLPAVLALASAAMMCGARSLYAIAQWGRDHGQPMARKLGLERHGTPAVSTLHEIFSRLDHAAFEACLHRWAMGWLMQLPREELLEVVSVDGKTLSGTCGHQLCGVHLLALYSKRLGITLDQVDAAHGEVPAASAMLERLVLEGMLITGDAQFTQRSLCTQIIQRGGHYLLVVKDNQPRLKELVDAAFRACPDPLFVIM